jgi:hypothetical protein
VGAPEDAGHVPLVTPPLDGAFLLPGAQLALRDARRIARVRPAYQHEPGAHPAPPQRFRGSHELDQTLVAQHAGNEGHHRHPGFLGRRTELLHVHSRATDEPGAAGSDQSVGDEQVTVVGVLEDDASPRAPQRHTISGGQRGSSGGSPPPRRDEDEAQPGHPHHRGRRAGQPRRQTPVENRLDGGVLDQRRTEPAGKGRQPDQRTQLEGRMDPPTGQRERMMREPQGLDVARGGAAGRRDVDLIAGGSGTPRHGKPVRQKKPRIVEQVQ